MMKNRYLILAAVLAAGCSDPSSPPDLSIVVVASASSLHAGERLTVNVTVLNTGTREHTITVNGCPAPFSVFDQEGNAVTPTSQICTADLRLQTLGPGDSYSFTSDWTGETSTLSNGTWIRQPVAPGTYSLRGQITAFGLGQLTGGLAQVVVLP
jgi:hypothetical protein